MNKRILIAMIICGLSLTLFTGCPGGSDSSGDAGNGGTTGSGELQPGDYDEEDDAILGEIEQ